jgi:predicted alpha/beta-hydrolase family hydrolase
MQKWKERLSTIGDTVAFDYPYMQQGRRRPDPRPQLIAAHRQALADARRDTAVFLIGKSMGGRMGCHVALAEKVEGVICLGYPLCGGGDPTKLRDEVLRELRTPILFVQGTRDSLCPLDLLERVRAEMTARTSLHVVEGGDHSLMVTKRQLAASGQTQEEVDRGILEAITRFVAKESGDMLPG